MSKAPENRSDPSLLVSQLAKARAGDPTAFATLLARYSPMIESKLHRKRRSVPSLTPEDEKDLRQEAYLAFFRAIQTYRTDQEAVLFGLYAKICVENALLSAIRQLRPAAETLDPAQWEAIPDGEGVHDPTRHLREEEDYRSLYDKIERVLSPMENNIWHCYTAGMTAGEIARTTGQSIRSVNNAIYRTRQKLRAVLRPEHTPALPEAAPERVPPQKPSSRPGHSEPAADYSLPPDSSSAGHGMPS